MKSYLLRLLKTFDYHAYIDFFQSLAPTHKYNIMTQCMIISAWYVSIDKLFGIDAAAFVALLVVFVTELVSGIVASHMRKEQFSSMKLSRFVLKVALYLVLIFVPYSFKNSFASHNQNVPAWVFDWLHVFLLTHIVIENIVSILENLAVISGNDKTAWINKIQDFLGEAITSLSTHNDATKQ